MFSDASSDSTVFGYVEGGLAWCFDNLDKMLASKAALEDELTGKEYLWARFMLLRLIALDAAIAPK